MRERRPHGYTLCNDCSLELPSVIWKLALSCMEVDNGDENNVDPNYYGATLVEVDGDEYIIDDSEQQAVLIGAVQMLRDKLENNGE
jgi:hypothetical protein